MVQRMSPEPSGKLQKYYPLETREFVPFKYDDLSLSNIKLACEEHFNQTKSSCDVLASDRGPSCSRLDQISGKKYTLFAF